MKNKYVGLAAVVVILVGGYFALHQKSKETNGAPVKIGTIFAQSGDAAYWGVDEQRVVEIAIEEANANGGINGTPIQLISEDAPAIGQISKAVSTVQKLVSVDHVNAILGPTWDDNAKAVAPLADQYKTVIISSSASSGSEPTDYKFFFSTNLPEKSEIQRMVEYAQKKTYKKIVIIHTSDSFSSLYSKIFTEDASAVGMTVQKEISINEASPKDFRTYIALLKNTNPDAIYLVLDDEGPKCIFLKQAKELGLKAPILSSISTQSPDSLEKCGDLMGQVSYTYQKKDAGYESLLAKYRAKYNADPSGPAITEAYDAANILITQMRAGNTSGDALQQGILGMKNFSGTTGEGMNFDSTGHLILPTSDFNIKTVKNGQFVIVE
jgi:branched-chain amino acid transport system substrate-binding protein